MFIWIFSPFVMTFLSPVIIFGLNYVTALIVLIFRIFHRLDISKIKDPIQWRKCCDGALRAIALMWDLHGYIWFGYEVEGLENIPDDGPALIVYYHGALPVDYYYLTSKYFLRKNRLIRSIGDHFLFQMPGFRLMLEVLQVIPGSIPMCVNVLKRGDLLSISPGGVREAQFGDENYNLIWGQRTGFAKVAIEAKVPIIPVFTQNIRESFRTLKFGQKWLRKLYEKFKIPCVPIYGGFPVKLKTIIGKPIPYDSSLSPEEVANNTAEAIEFLIKKNQRIPGNVMSSLMDRFA